MKMNLYFDCAATTKVCKEAINGITNTLEIEFGNPSSKHFKGMKAEDLVTKARKFIAKEIGSSKDELYFTSGGTESNNLAIFGIANAYKRSGNHIVTTSIEHPSVGASVDSIEEGGFKVSKVGVDREGFVDKKSLIELIHEDTILVSIMQVNNEIGTIQNIIELGNAIKLKNPKTLFHVDGIQGFMKLPINVTKAKIDLYSASSHKIYGPKGVGFLYIKKGIKIKPLQYGGSQQKKIRPGTENTPGIIGFYEAVKALSSNVETNYLKTLELKDYFIKAINSSLPEWELNSPVSIGKLNGEVASPYIVSIRSNSIKGEVILHALEDYQICISTGSACSSKKLNVSHVIKAIGISDKENDKTIRISFSASQSTDDIDELVKALIQINNMFGMFIKK